MSTDPTNDVGWTVPDDLEWGGDAHDGEDDESTGDDDASAREPATTRTESVTEGPAPARSRRGNDTTRSSSTDGQSARRRQSFVDDLDLGSAATADDGAESDGERTQTTVTDGSGRVTATDEATIASTTAASASSNVANSSNVSSSSDVSGSFADRHPADLPPAPVLAAHVDLLREERDAAESHRDAVRDRYERELRARNREIARLRRREGASFLERCWMRLERLF